MGSRAPRSKVDLSDDAGAALWLQAWHRWILGLFPAEALLLRVMMRAIKLKIRPRARLAHQDPLWMEEQGHLLPRAMSACGRHTIQKRETSVAVTTSAWRVKRNGLGFERRTMDRSTAKTPASAAAFTVPFHSNYLCGQPPYTSAVLRSGDSQSQTFQGED